MNYLPTMLFASILLFSVSDFGFGKPRKKAVGKKNITVEKKIDKDRKNYDFDSVSIDGQRRVPLGTLINQKQAHKDYEFVKIRLRWRQEMIQSASDLNL